MALQFIINHGLEHKVMHPSIQFARTVWRCHGLALADWRMRQYGLGLRGAVSRVGYPPPHCRAQISKEISAPIVG